ncbi:MAG TPA: cation:proton antiporter [Candidatus Thermoplasmatota archaeon]|nr:cation:proton antiporter [Candidatus Thermoplasmatota archaeon]
MASEVGPALLAVAIVLVAAKLAGALFIRLRQPAVVGELLVGVFLGTVVGRWLGVPDFAGPAGQDPSQAVVVLEGLATLGAILLLFDVGLETDFHKMRQVGLPSALVALIGIVGSFVVGYAASWGLGLAWPAWVPADHALPGWLLHTFVGAALTATSVGITARVLKDLGRLQARESRIILGAAVLDDVGGLLILAVVTALVQVTLAGDALDVVALVRVVGIALAFLASCILLGARLLPSALDGLVARVRVPGLALGLAVSLALLFAFGAGRAGLADIVGAFAAGMVLAGSQNAPTVARGLKPLLAILVPFFFVVLGLRVDLSDLGPSPSAVAAVALLLTAVAVFGKLACGWGVVGGGSRWAVGVGMVPRGEVGLIFAGVGITAGLLQGWQYTILLLVVLLTTVVTPPWLGRLKDRFTLDRPTTTNADGAPGPP